MQSPVLPILSLALTERQGILSATVEQIDAARALGVRENE